MESATEIRSNQSKFKLNQLNLPGQHRKSWQIIILHRNTAHTLSLRWWEGSLLVLLPKSRNSKVQLQLRKQVHREVQPENVPLQSIGVPAIDFLPRAGAMAPLLRAWLLFQGSWVQFPAPTCWFTTICMSSSKGSNTSFWPPLAPGMHAVHRHTRGQNAHTHIM